MNDSMGEYVASQVVKGAEVLVLGITFKENCHDVRNTKVVDVIAEMKEYGIDVQSSTLGRRQQK